MIRTCIYYGCMAPAANGVTLLMIPCEIQEAEPKNVAKLGERQGWVRGWWE